MTTTKLPPFANWSAQTFAYGFFLERVSEADYYGSYAPGQSGRTGLRSPEPDDIHLLNLNPTQIEVDEPKATSVDYTQGGGKFIESRGDVTKILSIRGTTGLLPPIAPYATQLTRTTIDNALTAPDTVLSLLNEQLGEGSGFKEFYLLRRLFRKFGDERRAGKVVFMHYLDFKGDEFWVVEPRRFSMSRKRFTYEYSIQCDMIEPSEAPAIARVPGGGVDSTRRRTQLPLNVITDTPTRQTLQRMSQLVSSGAAFVKQFAYGTLAIKMQEVISKGTALQTFFADVSSIIKAALEIPVMLTRQLSSALIGLGDAFFQVTPAALRRDVNEWYLELRFLTDNLLSYYQEKFGTTPGQQLVQENQKYTSPRAANGTNNNLMQESAGSTGSPSVDPFIGGSGFQLIGDVRRMAAITSLRAEDVLTGETIFDLAQRLLNDVQRFIDLVILNKLKSPYIVADKYNKPPGTIAWGEQILVPVEDTAASQTLGQPTNAGGSTVSGTVSDLSTTTTLIDVNHSGDPWREDQFRGYKLEVLTGDAAGDVRVVSANDDTSFTVNRAFSAVPAPGDTYRVYLELFTRRRAFSPETRAFGRDIMAVFVKTRGVVTEGKVDLMVGPHGDVMTVEGEENLMQAITMRFQTAQGSKKLHPTYGMAAVVGRPMDVNTQALYVFFARQGLLLDPRIASVEKPKLEVNGNALYFTAYIRPIRIQRTSLFRIAL